MWKRDWNMDTWDGERREGIITNKEEGAEARWGWEQREGSIYGKAEGNVGRDAKGKGDRMGN